MNKIGKTLIVTLASVFTFVPTSNAVNLTLDELGSQILSKNPNCSYINVIGGHVFTDQYDLKMEDLLLGSRSIKTEISNEDVKNKSALDKMSTWVYDAEVDQDFNYIGYSYTDNLTGKSAPAADQVYDIDYIDNEYVGNKLKVTFVVDGVKTTELMEKDSKITKPADPVKDGYLFKGWKVNGEAFDFENSTLTEDIELVADFKNQTATVEDETSLNLALADSEITKIVLGKSFTVDSSVIVSRDIVIDGANNKISFKSVPKFVSGGSNYVFKVYGAAANKKINVTLSNMEVSNSLGAIIAGNNSVVTVDNVDVSGNAWGGIEVVDTLVVKSIKMTDEYLEHPVVWVDKDNVEKANVTFDGSFKTTVKEQTHYYLSEENSKVAKYTVTFNDGVNNSFVTYEKDAKVAKPADPTREGYKFIEWRLKDQTTAFDFENSKVTANIELVAEWKATTVEVTDEVTLNAALSDAEVNKIVLANSFEVNSSVKVLRSVEIEGKDNNTISFKTVPTYAKDGDNYVFKVYGDPNAESKMNVSFKNMKVSNSLGAILVGTNAVVTVDTVDVADNVWGGIEVVDTLVVKSITMNDENYAHPTVWVDEGNVGKANVTFDGSTKVKIGEQDQYYLVEANSKAYQVKDADDLTKALADKKITNIALSGDITVTSDKDNPLTINRDVNIDLKSHKVTGRLYFKGDTNINIKNGTIENTAGNSVDADGEKAVMTLNNVTVKSGAQAINARNGAKIVLNDVTAEGESYALVALKGTLEVNSGTYTALNGSAVSTNGLPKYAGNSIIINGGTFNSNITEEGKLSTGIYVPNNDNVVVNAGTFNVKNGVGILARGGNTTIKDGVIFNVTGKGTGTVASDTKVQVPAGEEIVQDFVAGNIAGYVGNPIITNNSKYTVYVLKDAATKEDLVNNLKDESVNRVVLNGDLELDKNLVISRDVTLDLNNYSVNKAIIVNKGNAVIENGTITTEGGSVSVAGEGAAATLNNMNVTSTKGQAITVDSGAKIVFNSGNVNSQETALAVRNGSSLEVNGGTFTTVDNNVVATNGKEGFASSTVVINGGTFNGNIKTSGWIACGVYVANKDNVTLNGGTFNITDGVGVLARSGNTTINDKVVFNVTSKLESGWIGDSKIIVPSGYPIVKDLKANYPGGKPTVVNNSNYDVQTNK